LDILPLRFSPLDELKGSMGECIIEPFFSEMLRMTQKTLVAVDPSKSVKLIRLIVPKDEPVLNRNGPNNYLCPRCQTVLIRGAEPGAISAKPLVLICDCGTQCATGPTD
jgi:RNase P subunit RPR2